MDIMFSQSQFFPSRYIEIYDYHTLISLVEEGAGIAMVSDINILYNFRRLRASFFSLMDSHHDSLCLCCRKTMYISHLMEKFIELCRTVPIWM